MTGHRHASTGRQALCADRGACRRQIDAHVGLSTRMPRRREAGSGRRGWCRVTRSVHLGRHPYDEIRVPAPARCGRQRSADDAAASFIGSLWPVIGGAGHGGHRTRRALGKGRPWAWPLFPARGAAEAPGSSVPSRVRSPGIFTCARCPAVTGTLEAGGAAPYPGAARPPAWSAAALRGGERRRSRHLLVTAGAGRKQAASPGICANHCPCPGIAGRGLSHPPGVTPHHGRSRAELCRRPGPAGSWGHERLIGWRCP